MTTAQTPQRYSGEILPGLCLLSGYFLSFFFFRLLSTPEFVTESRNIMISDTQTRGFFALVSVSVSFLTVPFCTNVLSTFLLSLYII